ncbi:hypothetical protein [Moraxella lacunata]|uniref:hypothetical protein n=1 Tax=Moraxella lacunata TaxID=477 RepID=UPI003EE0F2A6
MQSVSIFRFYGQLTPICTNAKFKKFIYRMVRCVPRTFLNRNLIGAYYAPLYISNEL